MLRHNIYEEDEEDFELGGWAVIHDSGDLIADGFDSEEAAQSWLIDNEDMLEDPIEFYHTTEVED